MSNESVILALIVCSSIACVVLGLSIVRRPFAVIDRLAPFLVQFAFWAMALAPMLHGTPDEHLRVVMLTLPWLALVLFSSHRLRRSGVPTARWLGSVQFLQAIVVAMQVAAGYIASCYYWDGLRG